MTNNREATHALHAFQLEIWTTRRLEDRTI